jgi:hypothetical protein
MNQNRLHLRTCLRKTVQVCWRDFRSISRSTLKRDCLALMREEERERFLVPPGRGIRRATQVLTGRSNRPSGNSVYRAMSTEITINLANGSELITNRLCCIAPGRCRAIPTKHTHKRQEPSTRFRVACRWGLPRRASIAAIPVRASRPVQFLLEGLDDRHCGRATVAAASLHANGAFRGRLKG